MGGIPTAHAHVLTSKKIMESSENIFNIETVLRHSGMFQGGDNV